MKIRRLVAADWAIFRDIRLEMLSQAPGAFGSSFTDWVARPEAEIRDWMERMHVLGAFDRRSLVATVALARAGSSLSQHRGEVISVYTKPERRGQGILKSLLLQLAEDARETGILQLELQVAADNTQAIAAYQTIGFEVTGRIPRAVRHDGDFADDLTMVWPLDGT